MENEGLEASCVKLDVFVKYDGIYIYEKYLFPKMRVLKENLSNELLNYWKQWMIGFSGCMILEVVYWASYLIPGQQRMRD